MITTLAYGKEGLELNIPDRHHVDIVEPVFVHGLVDQEAAVAAALNNPIASEPLNRLVPASAKVGIIVSDITRPMPYAVVLPMLLRALGHIPDRQITFFCATGTHRLCTADELKTILGADLTLRHRIVQNDVRDPHTYLMAGTTSSGNTVYLHKELLACDLIIPTGFIEPHFFAGFSGGGKAIMPGMASLRTIRHNHSIHNLEHSGARWGITLGNPIWEEVMEAASLAGEIFLCNVTLNKKKEITGVFAGELRETHNAGCAFAKDTAMVAVPQPYDIVITSNSGYPLDLNIYQSVKGMSAAGQIAKSGGSIIIASECWDGIPEGSDYEKILASVHSPRELNAYIRQNELQHQDTWQVFLQSVIQQKADVYLYSDRLSDDQIRRALLQPTRDIPRLLDALVDRYGHDSSICIMPEGPHTIPYVQTG